MRTAFLLTALLSPAAAAAQSSLHFTYEGSLAGVHIVHVEANLDQSATGYTMRTRVSSVGAVAVLASGHTDVLSQGVWQGAGAAPTHIDSEGYWNGQTRRLIIDYQDNRPLIRIMVPAPPARRRAIDRDSTTGTTDALGLVVALMRQVTTTGGCARSTRVFDGTGVTQFDMTPAAATTPPLRCDFTTRKVAGPHANAGAGRIGRGYALFDAASPTMPALPVRIVFDTGWTGNAVLALTAASPGP